MKFLSWVIQERVELPAKSSKSLMIVEQKKREEGKNF